MKTLKTKEEIMSWLDEVGICDYTIEDDLTVNVQGGVNFYVPKLDSFPVQFGKVDGNFDCAENELTSLVGSPREVTGSFYCNHCKLTSLKGGPIKVGGNFHCSYNQLTSLEFCPEEVGFDFCCYDNQITTLKFFPKSVWGSVEVQNNPIETIVGFNCKFGNTFFHDTFIIPELEEYYLEDPALLKDGRRERVLYLSVAEMMPIVSALNLKNSLDQTIEEKDNKSKKKIKL